MNSHKSVLTAQAISYLEIKPTSSIIDATYGSGGHAKEIIARLGRNGRFLGIDQDEDAISLGKKFLNSALPKTELITENFRNIDMVVREAKFTKIDGILADLGWRMEQFSGSNKGFSFLHDEPLLMTYGNPRNYSFTASNIVNEWSEKQIADIIFGYGEERYARRIAHAIVARREKSTIDTTFSLVKIIESAIPHTKNRIRLHPATKTFQALRIAVNDELDALNEFLLKSVSLLSSKGRIVVITFHSLEDRIVKHLFRRFKDEELGNIVTKKPIKADRDEIRKNPRSRSAKMRVFEKSK